MPNMLATGDDDGVIKVGDNVYDIYPRSCGMSQLWDPRKPDAIRTYNHHHDYITDFLWLEDKKQLVATR